MIKIIPQPGDILELEQLLEEIKQELDALTESED